MPALNTDTSFDFLFAKLHGVWANSVQGEALERLIKSATPELLQRNLEQIGLGAEKREVFHQKLVSRELRQLDKVGKLLDDGSAGFYRAFIARVYFENLKTVLHYRFFPEKVADIESLLLEAPGVPKFDAKELLAAKNNAAFVNLLPLHQGVTVEFLFNITNALEKSLDIMTAECALDQLYYDNLLRAAGHAAFNARSQAKRLVSFEIDTLNLCMLLRNTKTYHLATKKLLELCLHGGGVMDRNVMEHLAGLGSVERLVANLPQPFYNLLSHLTSGDLYLSENALWRHIYQEALKLFRDFDQPARSIVAFPFLIHFETLNIGRVYEAVHFGIPARDMQDMMIGVL